jgi:biotin transport system substrate-specific component
MTTAPNVFAYRVVPHRRALTITLVVGFALLTAAAAQIRIPLPFTPVPITGQTFAVLLSGAALGSMSGAASQLLYVALGAIGLPFYAGGASGWEVVSGATGGYLIGFIAAAWVIGKLAEQQQDRKVGTAIGAFLTGNLVIYAFGIVGLMAAAEMSLTDAVANGMAPFIVGDTIKVALAAALLPTAWKLTENKR